VTVWLSKSGPVLRWSRAVHVAIGFLAPAWGHHAHGNAGLGFGMLAVAAAGGLWELSTPIRERIRPGWGGYHPYADARDLAAFLVGAALAALVFGGA
jgi:hypothetical protein